MSASTAIRRAATAIVLCGIVNACSGAPAPPSPVSTSSPDATLAATPVPPTTTAPTATAPALREVVDVAYEKNLMPASVAGVEPMTQVKLDVYAPSQGGSWPVVIWAPGGGETRISGRAFGRLMASRGAVVFVIDTAHGSNPEVKPLGYTSRSLVEQAACAVRTARALAPQYDGNPLRIIWTGYSLGGVFGFELGLADPDFERLWTDFVAKNGGPPPTVECLTTAGSSAIDALVIGSSGRLLDIYPTIYDADLVLRDFTKSVSHIGNNTSLKVRLVHGNADAEVPFALAEALDRDLRAAKYDVTLAVVDGGGHDHYDDQLVKLVLEVVGAWGS